MTPSGWSPWPQYSAEEIAAVARVMQSNRVNYWTGTEGREFEREFAEWAGATHAVALTNGTVALDLALRALKIGPGADVIVTPRTFIASVSAVVLAGARPVFADVDRESGNLTVETIERALTPATRAILPVHLGGWPCDMPAIRHFADHHGLTVIEDCAQAAGARCGGKMVGTFGDIGAWSFCQDKIITTGGEGGMVTTDNPGLWATMWSYKDHGKSWDAVHRPQHTDGFRWVHDSFGTNWRMLETQAAIGRIQVARNAADVEQRAQNARRFATACSETAAARVPLPPPDFTHAFYRLYAYVNPPALRSGWTRDRIVHELRALDVACQHGTCPEVYLEHAFDSTDFRPAQRLPVASELGETGFAFLVHPSLTPDEIDRMCERTTALLRQATA